MIAPAFARCRSRAFREDDNRQTLLGLGFGIHQQLLQRGKPGFAVERDHVDPPDEPAKDRLGQQLFFHHIGGAGDQLAPDHSIEEGLMLRGEDERRCRQAVEAGHFPPDTSEDARDHQDPPRPEQPKGQSRALAEEDNGPAKCAQ